MSITMAVRPDYFVDDFGQKELEGFAVFEIDGEGEVCGMVTGINHPTREDAEREMAELSVVTTQAIQSQTMQEITRSGKAGALMVAASRSPDSVRAIAGQLLGRPEQVANVAPHIVVGLPDGYNGHTANFVGEPVERDGNLVKLKCADRGREYKIRWIPDADLQSAIASQVANAKAWEYRDEKEGVSLQSLDRLPTEKRGQWTSERPLDAVPASLVGLDVSASDQAEERAVKPRMRP